MARRKKADVDTTAFIGMVRQWMAEHDKTPTDFAALAEIELAALSRLLSDSTRRPEPETVVAIARAMGKPVWNVAVAAGYPFNSPGIPSTDDERLLRLIQSDARIRDVLNRYYRETSPEKRESLLQLAIAILNRHEESGQSPG